MNRYSSKVLTCSKIVYTVKGWAQVKVAYLDVYVIENMAVVEYRSTSKFSCFGWIILYKIIIITGKSQKQITEEK